MLLKKNCFRVNPGLPAATISIGRYNDNNVDSIIGIDIYNNSRYVNIRQRINLIWQVHLDFKIGVLERRKVWLKKSFKFDESDSMI